MKKPRFSNLSIQIGLNLLTIFTVASLLFANRVVAAPAGQSAVPGIIPYQATLVDRQGNPVHGPIDIIFRLYAVPEGGTEMWVEEHIGPNAVSVIDGRFEVNLGSIEPLSTYIWNEPQLYLGVQIGSDPEMTPRPEIGIVPYSLFAQVALSVPDGAIGTPQLADRSVTVSKLNVGRYKFYYSVTSGLVHYWGPQGVESTLDPATCTQPGAWCCNDDNQICYLPGGSGDSILAFNIQGSPSGACTLLHEEDDDPVKSKDFYYATDMGNGINPFGEWAVMLSKEGVSTLPIANSASYLWFCP
jgi:hypothetical protein